MKFGAPELSHDFIRHAVMWTHSITRQQLALTYRSFRCYLFDFHLLSPLFAHARPRDISLRKMAPKRVVAAGSTAVRKVCTALIAASMILC